jgi:hypothetical protein
MEPYRCQSTPAKPLASDNVGVVSITQDPPPGSTRLAGTTSVTLTAYDAAMNTRSINFDDVTVADGTNPDISVPLDGFKPATITADADGTAALPDYTSQATGH